MNPLLIAIIVIAVLGLIVLSRSIRIVPQDEGQEPVEYLIPKGKHLPVQEGDFIEKGDSLEQVRSALQRFV